MKNIISVGFDFPGGFTDFINFKSDKSLLDYDIIIFSPDMFEFSINYHKTYMGKPSLGDTASFALQEQIGHWRRELTDACNAGKTIFVFLEKLDEVFIRTGRQEYSGTGSKRVTTNLVIDYDNYKCIPFEIGPINSKGSSMKLSDKSNLISSYWQQFENYSEYHILMNDKVSQILINTRDGSRVVGGIVKLKSSDGNFVFLPHLDVDSEEFFTEDENDEGFAWTQKGIEFGNSLLASLIEIDKTLKTGSRATPTPDWVNIDIYELPKEKMIKEKLLVIETNINKQIDDKEKLKIDLSKEISLKNLLYENDKLLENAIIDALQIIGFNADGLEDGESEFDVVFESKEGRLLGKAEGKDTKQINITKLRQLEMNLLEDFEREDVSEVAKGVLFGNAYRLQPLEKRNSNFFTTKCISAAKRNKTALVRTTDLFFITKYLLTETNSKFAKSCREAILNSDGDIVDFPNIPKGKPSPKEVTSKK